MTTPISEQIKAELLKLQAAQCLGEYDEALERVFVARVREILRQHDQCLRIETFGYGG